MKKTIFLIVGIMMVLWLSACNGGDNQDVKNGNDNSGATTNETDNENTEDITLRFAWWGDQHRTDYTLEVIDLFEEQNRSEEHTSELQSRGHLVCRLLLEK